MFQSLRDLQKASAQKKMGCREVSLGSLSEALSVFELITNMLDVPAEVIALLYRYRWLIELWLSG